MITLHTNFGDIQIELNEKLAPRTCENFLNYAKEGFYDGTTFHRVIDNFMIQGGGMTPDMKRKETKAAIANEADNGLQNVRGSVAMARTNDPHSATSQFFINVAMNHFLDFKAKTPEGWGYCVFGKVANGWDVVEKIKAVKTGNRAGHQDVPAHDVIIEKVTIDE